jgi:hypothetical protein
MKFDRGFEFASKRIEIQSGTHLLDLRIPRVRELLQEKRTSFD